MRETEARVSYVDLLTVHRELLVSRLKSIQCLLDNLSACGFFCEEDVDIVHQTVTRTEKVGEPKHLRFQRTPGRCILYSRH